MNILQAYKKLGMDLLSFVFADGNFVGATLDRNGLRPARYSITNDGFVIMGSETGVVDLEEERVIEKGRLGPGQMLAVDFRQNRILRNWEVKSEAAQRHNYKNFSSNRTIKLKIMNGLKTAN